MSNPNAEIIGKPVKDMYGSLVGTTVGTLTDIDGSVHTVGVDCGHSGLMQIPYSVVQDCDHLHTKMETEFTKNAT